MYERVYKGKYKPINQLKYRGDITQIVARSSWEHRFMKWCDMTPSVLEWGSEIAVIPYKSPVDSKIHRYFVDFYIKIQSKAGTITKYLVEIKPEKFTKPPTKPKKQTRKFIEEVFQYGINQAKWKSATEFCENRGMKFLILTENDLGIKINN